MANFVITTLLDHKLPLTLFPNCFCNVLTAHVLNADNDKGVTDCSFSQELIAFSECLIYRLSDPLGFMSKK
jgi:hypothetical protein